MEIMDEVQDLAQLNWQETGFDFPLNINRALYETLSDAGLLVCLAAYDEGAIVGYSTAFIGQHAFNPDVIACESNALFVHPDHRAGLVPGRLIVETERAAKRRGATHMSWNTRANTPLASIFARRGYIVADQVVMRAL